MARPTSRLSRVLMTGPMAPFANKYELELKERGYTPHTTVNQLRQVARLSGWLEASGFTVAELSEERVGEFLAFQRNGGRHRSSWSRPGLLFLLEVLRGLGVVVAAGLAVAKSPTDVLLAAFERYLLAERGLAAGTVRGYVRHAHRFMVGFSPVNGLAGLTAAHVTEAVLRESEAVSVSATQFFVAGLRSFLRFCFIERFAEVDLLDARALLGGCDRRSALGRRDYAMLHILLRLGMRASVVAGLELDDFEWRAGELLVRGKRGREDRLPLPMEVGEAVAAYLQRGRPTSDRREVFLRARAPFRPIAARTVSSTVRRACRRAGVAEVGSHRLRHTVACEMVSAGVPLVQIGQVLRHQSLQSTAIYARVDIDRLRQLAKPWPGIVQR